MKRLNKILFLALVLFAFAAVSSAYAFTFSSPAEIVSNLTGKSAGDIAEQRFDSGKTYGEIAYDENKWAEFREEMLENKKAYLDERVKEGVLSQKEADKYYNYMLEMQEYCDGNGAYGKGTGCGLRGRGMMGFGQEKGMGRNWQQ